MKWQDEGILLTFAPFGEKSQVISAFTKHHGRYKGLFRPTRHYQAVLNPGSIQALSWNARLEDHLGLWQFEALFSPLAWILQNPLAMYALQSAISLLDSIIPERESHPLLYQCLRNLMMGFRANDWLQLYIAFEIALINHSGFPLDLTHCAVTGIQETLIYVSPRTGKAVSEKVGLAYHDRLLALPTFINDKQSPTFIEALMALDLTEHFLERYSLGTHGLLMPQARVRFKEHLKAQQKRKIA